jgi:hypothetical protein
MEKKLNEKFGVPFKTGHAIGVVTHLKDEKFDINKDD